MRYLLLFIIPLVSFSQQTRLPSQTVAEKKAQDKFKRSRLTSDKSEMSADRRNLLLATGEDKVVDLDFSANVGPNGISIGNPKVVATTLVKLGEKRQIVFKPLQPGGTTVTVRDREGQVRLIFDVKIAGANLLRVTKHLRELLRDVEGINFTIRGDRVFIDGEVLVPNDYGRLYQVLNDENSPYKGLVVNLVTLSPIALRLVAKRIQKDIGAFASAVTTRVVNDQVWLEGTVDNLQQARRAVKVAELYLPQVKPAVPLSRDEFAQRLPPRSLVQNFIVVNPPPPKKKAKLVRVTIHFVELSKDYNKVFGFKWQPGFTSDPQVSFGQTAQGATGASGASFTATLSSLFPKLQSAQSAGFARVLRTGTVIVRSGLPANLTEETTIPFAVIAPNGQASTSQVGVGLTVGVTPSILGQTEDIELDVNVNQKNQSGKTNTDAPIVSQRAVRTKVYVKSKESAAIAAISSTDVQTSFNKDDPDQGGFGGNSTSPLFTMLRSKSYAKKKAQFVIFITPQIIEGASQGSEDLKKNFRVKM